MKKQNENNATVKSVHNLEFLHDFFINLRKATADTGLTAYALGKKIGVDYQAIQRITQGGRDPSFSTVVRIVKGMQISMDKLLEIAPVEQEKAPVPSPPVPEVEIKKEKIGFINKIAKMHDHDVELLEAIASILDERRSRAMARLLHAVNDVKPPDDKNGRRAKDARSLNKPKVNKSVSDDDLEDDDFEDDFDDEDDIFDDELDDELEDDDIFDDDDDLDDDDDFDDEN